MIADGEEQALAGDRGNQLLCEQGKQYSADGCEVEVVQFEEKAQFERLALAHQLPAAEDYNVVCDERNSARLECGERCLARDEAEVLRLVADNGLKGLLENRPELQAERPIERRRAELDPVWETHGGRERRGQVVRTAIARGRNARAVEC